MSIKYSTAGKELGNKKETAHYFILVKLVDYNIQQN